MVSINDSIRRHSHQFYELAMPATLALLDLRSADPVEGGREALGLLLDTEGGVDWLGYPNTRRGVVAFTSRIQYDCEFGTITLRMSEYRKSHAQWIDRSLLSAWRVHAYVHHTKTACRQRHVVSLYAVREADLHAFLHKHPEIVTRRRRNSEDGRWFIYPYVWELRAAGVEMRSMSHLRGMGYWVGPGGIRAPDLAAVATVARELWPANDHPDQGRNP